ncbi:hypothetical protein SLE2022_101810 [Rubroshorea leprosula]
MISRKIGSSLRRSVISIEDPEQCKPDPNKEQIEGPGRRMQKILESKMKNAMKATMVWKKKKKKKMGESHTISCPLSFCQSKSTKKQEASGFHG